VRALDLTSRRFRREWALFAPRGSAEHRAIVQVLRDLSEASVLPGPDDLAVELPMMVMARAVPETKLLVAYVAGPDVVTPLALIARPVRRG